MQTMCALLITAGVMLGCGDADDARRCYEYRMIGVQNATEYDFSPNIVTPEGISVDTSGYDVDLDRIDQLVHATEECMQGAYATLGEKNQILPLDPSCLKVKIAEDWFTRPCKSTGQIFPCDISERKCGDRAWRKEYCEETAEFQFDGCYCHGTVQDEEIIIVTPNLGAFSHELVHIVADVDDPIPEVFDSCTHNVPECPSP